MVRVNVFGLMSGFLMLYLVLLPEPWWVALGGSDGEAFHAYVSPFAFEVVLLGNPVDIPIVYWLTLASRLAFILAAVETIFASIVVYEKTFKTFLSLRALSVSILFPILIAIGLAVAEETIGLSIPVYGEALSTFNLPGQGYAMTVEMPIRTYITASYLLALIAGVLSLIARSFHEVLIKTEPSIGRV